MKKTIIHRGFTVLELLVVCALLGILAAIVFSSLNSAKREGSDASIKSTMTNLRTQAEIIYNLNNYSYASFCASATTTTLLKSAEANGPGAAYVCNSETTAWAASVDLHIGGWFCADNTGFATSTNLVLTAGDTTCL